MDDAYICDDARAERMMRMMDHTRTCAPNVTDLSVRVKEPFPPSKLSKKHGKKKRQLKKNQAVHDLLGQLKKAWPIFKYTILDNLHDRVTKLNPNHVLLDMG